MKLHYEKIGWKRKRSTTEKALTIIWLKCYCIFPFTGTWAKCGSSQVDLKPPKCCTRHWMEETWARRSLGQLARTGWLAVTNFCVVCCDSIIMTGIHSKFCECKQKLLSIYFLWCAFNHFCLQAAARKGKLRDSYDYFHFLNEFRWVWSVLVLVAGRVAKASNFL